VDALDIALAVAREHALPTDRPRVVRDLTNLLVHLEPAPVVARVQLTLSLRGRAWAEEEIRAAQFLAAAGAPVAPPADGVDPGPHEREGLLVTFWRVVDHEPARADPKLAGHSLRELHDAFAGYDGALPTCDRLDEVRRLLENEELREFADKLQPLDGEPIHGDAHLRNILWTPDGPLWSDLENICRGPREYDLACIRFRPAAENDAAIAAYGEHDAEALAGALVYVTLFLAAVTPLVAARGGDSARAEAERRVQLALRYAREM
jgi:hypothetical protein